MCKSDKVGCFLAVEEEADYDSRRYLKFFMTNKTYGAWIGVLIVVVAGVVVYSLIQKNQTPLSSTNSTTPANVVPAPIDNPLVGKRNTIYETANLKVTIPDGWTAKEAALPVYVGTSTTPTYTPNPAAVNITNGKWILYINTNASQASGTPGGRFAEIGMGAPSVDAVVTFEPGECGKTTSTSAFDQYVRVDYSMSAAEKNEWCVAPTNGKTIWFFSYLTSLGNGFFNDYVLGSNPGLVVTMAYDSKVVNDFPVVGSPDLTAALQSMTNIASSLVIKIK